MQEHTQQHSTQQAIIRTLRRDDHADLIDLVRQIWYPQCSQRCGRLAATVDWETALSDATIAKVAEEEGHPIAVILGRVDRHDSRAAWNIHRRRALKALAALAFSGEGRRILADLLGIAAVDNRMFRRRRHDYPAEVTLFLVSPSARGLGLGKRLFNTLMDEFRAAGVHEYFLYTDTSCNVGFYEHLGLQKVDEQQFTEMELPQTIDEFYLYEGKA